MPSLPPNAFVPKHHLDALERREFVEKRDRLFAQCSPDEQARLVELAQWYETQRHQLLKRPNAFSDAYTADFHHRYLPWMHAKPAFGVRVMGKVWTRILGVETWLGARLEARLMARLEGMRHQGGDEVVMGVANFLRALPLRSGWDSQRALEEQLEQLAQRCVTSKGAEAQARMASLLRSLRAEPEGEAAARLRTQIWPVLLALTEQDLTSGLQFVDAHWDVPETSRILVTLYLHETPELACRLATLFEAHRPAFATEMMAASLMYSSFRYDKIEGAERESLAQIMDASCLLLASWLDKLPRDEAQARLRAVATLFQFGDPAAPYWTTLPAQAIAAWKALDRASQRLHLRVLAQIPFYAVSNSLEETEGMQLFEHCADQIIAQATGSISSLESALYELCNALSILEDKIRSYRNPRVAANPAHRLRTALEARLQGVLARAVERAPESALQSIVGVALALSNQVLVRKLHQILRQQFERRARAFPADAGAALKRLIEYRYYSHAQDEMYLSEICQETFDLLLPVLDGIAPGDAAVARTGIGWNPRDEFM